MKFILSLLFALGVGWGEWIMFADKQDTYLYNNQTGEVYIRYKKNRKNYEDVFIKMPHGISPEQIQPPLKPTQNEKNHQDDLKMQSLKKTQELMNDALKGAF
ncbi:hypothetical protein [Helicobacter cholecystus]|uniref:hypothetical protein n=1 Tax=Helicobacter cholecystus TaxID=45498 RepID=UPI0027389B59|nr:hypothetical protein [Helicobacter cholecystus]